MLRRIVIGFCILVVLGASFLIYARFSGRFPGLIRQRVPYHEVDAAFRYPRAVPGRFTLRGIVVSVNVEEESFLVMDVAAFAGCNDFTCGLFYIPVHTPLRAPGLVPGARKALRYEGTLPAQRDLVFIDGHIARNEGIFEFIAQEVRDSKGRVLISRPN